MTPVAEALGLPTGAPDSECGAPAGAMPAASAAESLRWSRFLPATRAEGPGLRSALWVQGCEVRCPGCFNPQLWAARGGILSDPPEVAAEWVAGALSAGAEGITLLGGEPFDQAAALAPVARAFQAAGLTVMTFSGYPWESLEGWAEQRADIRALLDATDLLCDGPYLRQMPEIRRPWIGSANQGIRALTDVYAEAVRTIARDGGRDTLEIRISPDGTVGVNGWATDAALAVLLDDLGVRADHPRTTERAA